jgi:hypothetical protein
MNMLYEGLKQNATFVIVPSTVLETMQLDSSCFGIALRETRTETAGLIQSG